MNIINIDYEKGVVQSDFYEWQIVCNGRFHAAEADIKKNHIWEVKEITFRAPEGEIYVLEEDTGIIKL